MMPLRLPSRPTTALLALSIPALLTLRATMSTSTSTTSSSPAKPSTISSPAKPSTTSSPPAKPSTTSSPPAKPSTTPPPPKPSPPTFPTRPLKPRHTTSPYTPHDFLRADESPDANFYAEPRFVNHIDDHAIGLLKAYYRGVLPRRGRVLDLCCSWVSHFPEEVERDMDVRGMQKDGKEGLEVWGLGMNAAELKANPILSHSILQDLNANPHIPEHIGMLDTSLCVVSIDYLTRPVEVLRSLLERTRVGGSVHLVVSNRCFPSKVVGRWLRVGEEERLAMVGDFLHFAGWRGVEVVVVCEGGGGGWFGGGGVDPLWVVRGVKGGEGGGV